MRYALIISSCLCAAAWLNVAAEAQGPRQNKRQTRQTKKAERVESPDDHLVLAQETVKGMGPNQAEAEKGALIHAREWVLGFLREKHPGIGWKPSTDYIRDHLVKGEAKHLDQFDKELIPGAPDTRVECWGLTVAITSGNYGEMLRMEREHRWQLLREDREGRMVQRMDVLAKLLVAVVALLAAVAGYLRLEDWTKGYYTWWLRAAVIGFLSFVTLGLLFVA